MKNYCLVVDREKLSDNPNVKILVDDEEINFTLGKADVNVSSDTKNLNYKYELEDKTSQYCDIKLNEETRLLEIYFNNN